MTPTTRASGIMFLLLATVVLPLTALPPTISPDVTVTLYGAKTIVGWIAVIFGWMALLTHFRDARLGSIVRMVALEGPNKWLTAFIAVTLTAVPFSDVNVGVAMLGGSARLDGALVAILIYHLAQIAAALSRTSIITVRQTMTAVIVGGLGTAAFIAAEATGFQPWSLLDPGIVVGPAAVGTIGHPSTATIFFGVLFTFTVLHTLSLRRLRRAMVWAAALAFALVASLHAGRAGLLGVLTALMASIVLFALRRDRRWIAPAVGVFLLATTVYGLSLTVPTSTERTQRVTQAVTQPRVDLSMRLRFITWELGLKSVIANPWLGTGTASFADQIWIYASTEQESVLLLGLVPAETVAIARRSGKLLAWFDTDAEEFRFLPLNIDKAHNYFLDIGIHSGLLAVAAAAAFWISVMLLGLRAFRHQPALLAGTIAYLVALQFWFINVNVDPPIMVLIGVLSATAPPARAAGRVGADSFDPTPAGGTGPVSNL